MCHDESSCNDRCRWNNENVHWKCSSAGHGSRKAVPDGIFDADESLLKHANKVYLEYCTSDAHWANTEKWSRPDGGLLQFRGQVVVQSMITDLVERHSSRVKVAPWQYTSSPPAPPQGAPGGSRQLGAPRRRPAHWAPSHRLGCSSELAASEAAHSPAFDHSGTASEQTQVNVTSSCLGAARPAHGGRWSTWTTCPR